jgi:hypothetical protein
MFDSVVCISLRRCYSYLLYLHALQPQALVHRSSLCQQPQVAGAMSHTTPTQGNINHSMRTNYNEFGVDEVSSLPPASLASSSDVPTHSLLRPHPDDTVLS